MQLTVAVVILTALISLAIEGRSRAGAASFCAVVLSNFIIHVGPHWLVFSAPARSLGTALKHMAGDSTSSILAMLAAGLLGWLLAMTVRRVFSDEPRGDWNPDRPKRFRRASQNP